ncbi:MAG TPA: O-antigen ligase family protein [Verrucomicrobiota bacterium]|nr:O-antigen ligase family protein [Verrucomicrobiota bacterium]
MEQKHLVAAILLLASAGGGILVSCFSRRTRDVFFVLMVFLSAMSDRWDVNFVSREWYRGTTCGFEISIVDVLALSVLASIVVAPGERQRRWFLPASLGLMILYFLFNVFCVAIAEPKLFGLFALTKMMRGILIFLAAAFYVRGERELKLFLLGLGVAVCYEGLIALEQRYRFGIHRVFSDFDAPNSLSMYCCLTAPVFVAALNARLPRYLKLLGVAAIALAAIAVVLTISRAGVVTLALVLVAATLITMSWRFTARKVVVGAVVLAAAGGVLAKSWETLASRFHEANLEEEVGNRRSQGRGYYIRVAEAIVEENWFGVGPNNWSFWVSNRYGPRLGFKFAPYPSEDREPRYYVEADANVDDPQAAPAHNLAALTVGETGFAGLFLFGLLWLRWFQMGGVFLWRRTPDPMRRIPVGIFFGTWGIFLQSITEWVYHQTSIYFTFHVMLGVLASLYYVRRQAKRAARRAAQEAKDAALAMPLAPVRT